MRDPRITRKGILTILLMCLLAMGLWQTGEGFWIHAKARLAQFLLERAWTRAVAGEKAPKPWPWADTMPVARLRVVRYGIDLIVLANASGRTLAFGPAYLSSTAQPGGKGTTILTGHRDTHFAFLPRLQPTDEVLMETPDRRQYRYIVRDVSIVDGRTAIIGSDGMPRLALVTCYPFDAIMPGGPLRFVVIADLADAEKVRQLCKTLGAHRLAPVRKRETIYSSSRAPHYSSRRGPR